MTSADVMAAARIPVVRAAVTAGAVETVYWRAGCGPSVIFLRSHRCDDDLLAAQVVRLASHVRVIVPELVSVGALCAVTTDSRPTSAFTTWLSDFVEGLGVCGAHVVGTSEFAAELEALSRDAAELFGRVLCITRSPSDISDACMTSETSSHPVTYVRADDSWPDAVVQHIHAMEQRRG